MKRRGFIALAAGLVVAVVCGCRRTRRPALPPWWHRWETNLLERGFPPEAAQIETKWAMRCPASMLMHDRATWTFYRQIVGGNPSATPDSVIATSTGYHQTAWQHAQWRALRLLCDVREG